MKTIISRLLLCATIVGVFAVSLPAGATIHVNSGPPPTDGVGSDGN